MTPAPYINAVALSKENGERYVVLYDDRHAAAMIGQLSRWAANEDLSFTWYDAARMSQQVREAQRKAGDCA